MKQTLLLLFFLLLTALPAASLAQQPAAAQKPGYVLSAAYPNPFTTATTFSLRVQEPQEVKVEVYNMLGQRVKQLYQGPLDSGETRSFTFEAGSLPSGIYLYRVTGETFTASRQITLLR